MDLHVSICLQLKRPGLHLIPVLSPLSCNAVMLSGDITTSGSEPLHNEAKKFPPRENVSHRCRCGQCDCTEADTYIK